MKKSYRDTFIERAAVSAMDNESVAGLESALVAHVQANIVPGCRYITMYWERSGVGKSLQFTEPTKTADEAAADIINYKLESGMWRRSYPAGTEICYAGTIEISADGASARMLDLTDHARSIIEEMDEDERDETAHEMMLRSMWAERL